MPSGKDNWCKSDGPRSPYFSVSQQAEETIKLFLRNRDALGLVDVDVRQRFIQGAKTYLECPIPANTNMRDIVRARSLICRLNEVTALTGAAARVSVIDNPRADEEPSV